MVCYVGECVQWLLFYLGSISGNTLTAMAEGLHRAVCEHNLSRAANAVLQDAQILHDGLLVGMTHNELFVKRPLRICELAGEARCPGFYVVIQLQQAYKPLSGRSRACGFDVVSHSCPVSVSIDTDIGEQSLPKMNSNHCFTCHASLSGFPTICTCS